MKITKEDLQQIIKEELSTMITREPRDFKLAQQDVMKALKGLDKFKVQKMSAEVNKIIRVMLEAADPEARSTVGMKIAPSDIKDIILMLSKGARALDKVADMIELAKR